METQVAKYKKMQNINFIDKKRTPLHEVCILIQSHKLVLPKLKSISKEKK